MNTIHSNFYMQDGTALLEYVLICVMVMAALLLAAHAVGWTLGDAVQHTLAKIAEHL